MVVVCNFDSRVTIPDGIDEEGVIVISVLPFTLTVTVVPSYVMLKS